MEKEFDRKKDVLASKQDIGLLNEDISLLKEDIARSEARLTMRMFYFWIAQVAVISGILTYFFKSGFH